MTDDYGYLNARLRAKKGSFLRPRDYESALGTASLEEMVTFLEGTPYKTEVIRALTATRGMAGVDEGLRRDFQHTIDQMVGSVSGRLQELVTIVLGRWEIFNIKTVLRGRHAGAPLETVMHNVLPFGRLGDVALQELARQQDMKSAIDLLSQWSIPYARVLREAYPVYREKGDLQVLELALDRSFFASSLRGLDPTDQNDQIVADYLRREIDLLLVGYALRSVHHGVHEGDSGSVFIPGGRSVSAVVYGRMLAARSLDDLMKAVPDPLYVRCLEAGMPSYLEHRRLSALERSLETCFIKSMTAKMAGDPLSMSSVIGFLWLKLNEITNLRIISRGKYTLMPREEIEKYLVH
jgi:V/A-type H+-transporting ATPase subunit C